MRQTRLWSSSALDLPPHYHRSSRFPSSYLVSLSLPLVVIFVFDFLFYLQIYQDNDETGRISGGVMSSTVQRWWDGGAAVQWWWGDAS